MNKTVKTVLGIAMALLIGVSAYFLYSGYSGYLASEQQKSEEAAQKAEEEAAATQAPEPTPYTFTDPEGATNITLTFCGEIVGQSGLMTEAQNVDGTYDFTPIFSGAETHVKAADLAVCTLETTFPYSGDYSGYPLLKSPVEMATGIMNTGFDMVNTATSHAMDSGKEGLDFTITALDQVGLTHVGTYQSQAERDTSAGIKVRDINGVRVAFLSYTFGVTDMSSLTGLEYAVNTFCNSSWNIDYDKLGYDMQVARSIEGLDLIVVLTQWGTELDSVPTAGQKELTNFLFAQGADVVVGGHPRVPQPVELRKVKDDSGNERTCLVAYSLGSLASCNDTADTDVSVALNVTVQKNPATGKTYLRKVSYEPLFMADLEEYGITADWNFRVIDLHNRIGDYDAGETYGILNDAIYQAMVAGLDRLHGVMGEEMDYINGGVDVMKWNYEND